MSLLSSRCRGSRRFAPDGAAHRRRRPVGLANAKAFEARTGKARKTTASHLCSSPTWWLWRSGCTRSLSELGRETLQRQWYFVSRRGRVGRCQVCQEHEIKTSSQNHTKQTSQRKTRNIPTPVQYNHTHNAGWSSPVARQAHNLKAAGSNPAPATNDTNKPAAPAAGFLILEAFPMACRSVHSRIVARSPCSAA